MPQVSLDENAFRQAFKEFDRNIRDGNSKAVLNGLYQETRRVLLREIKAGVPVRTGLLRRRGIRGVIRKIRGVPYMVAVGAIHVKGDDERNKIGLRLHWTDEGTGHRTNRSGANRGRNVAQNYFKGLGERASRVALQNATQYLYGAVDGAVRKTARKMTQSQTGRRR